MELFTLSDREPERLLALSEDGQRIPCGALTAAAQVLGGAVGGHRLMFLLCENTVGTLLGYLGSLKSGIVPLLLDAHIAPTLLQRLMDTYRPGFLYVPQDLPAESMSLLSGGTAVLKLADSQLMDMGTGHGPALHPDLALLLTTSGSTGSPKLVRLSARNLDANARSIASYLGLHEGERPITNLPLSYSYGMSIINSHLLVGAAPVLTRRTVMERAFWTLMAQQDVTSLAGVPYTYQMFHRLGLTEMDLPQLRTLTQAGGKLSLALHREFAAWCAETDRRFFVMYGQTEAAPRMGYLPPESALAKCGSIGVPIPGGAFRLEDEGRGLISGANQTGELIYCGENVSMGYGHCPEDLSKGNEWGGILRTGDLATRDEEGFYYIVGRRNRFIKLYGNRVGLDEVERLLCAAFPPSGFACVGRDDCLNIYTDGQDPDLPGAVLDHLHTKICLPSKALHIRILEDIPKSQAGKILYAALPVGP